MNGSQRASCTCWGRTATVTDGKMQTRKKTEIIDHVLKIGKKVKKELKKLNKKDLSKFCLCGLAGVGVLPGALNVILAHPGPESVPPPVAPGNTGRLLGQAGLGALQNLHPEVSFTIMCEVLMYVTPKQMHPKMIIRGESLSVVHPCPLVSQSV